VKNLTSKELQMKLKGVLAGVAIIGLALIAIVALRNNDSTQVSQLNDAGQPVQDPPPATQQPPPQEASPAAGSVSATIAEFAYKPATLTVKKGTTVTWTNQDSVGHNVVSESGQPAGGPNGPLLAQGESYSFTFNTPGTFRYLCTPHPYMKGTVIVTE
jgi:amicyanin